MSFIGNENLTKLLNDGTKVIEPFNPKRILNGAYELSLGAEVFLTDDKHKKVKRLYDGEKIEIKPGQFALLLTKEYVKIPNNRIAFISIKAGIKFKGLVNVSGFHVDPGFEGNLLFSVYNAGPSNIRLSNGTAYFPIWFAKIDQEHQEYSGKHDNQTRIPDAPVEALSQGELASPNVLSKRIDENRHMKTKIEWVFLAIFTGVVALLVKVWTDSNKLKDAVDYGYKKKATEILVDSTLRDMKDSVARLNTKVDSLTFLVKKKR
jgi:dCTP deaminase